MRKRPISQDVKIRAINLSRKVTECPRCGTESKRHSLGHRWLRDLGFSAPTILEVTFSKHYCPKCERHFCLPMEHLARVGDNFTVRVRRTAVDMVTKQGLSREQAKELLEKKHRVHVPGTTIEDWVAIDTI